MKTCTKCKTLKSLNDFGRHPNTKDKLQSCCKSCRAKTTRKWYEKNKEYCREKRYERYKKNQNKERMLVKRYLKENPHKIKEYSLRAKYGIELIDYENMLIKQNNVCAICSKGFEECQPCVDHCHETGKIRGLLCSPCNRGLGMFADNEHSLIKAANYIKEFKCR